jgi:hypothetical protein
MWEGALLDGRVAGARAVASSSCPASTLVGGDWSTLYILQWGGVQIGADPYGNPNNPNFATGKIAIRCVLFVDFMMLRPASFSVASSVT